MTAPFRLRDPVRRPVAVLLPAILLACVEAPVDPGDPAVAAIRFQQDSLDLWKDWQVTLEPRLLAADGSVLEGREVRWSSTDEGVARVTSGGEVEGVAEGSAKVVAASEGVSGSLPVEVREAPAVEIASVEPDTVRPGELVTIRGQGFVKEGLRVQVAGLPARILFRTRQEVRAQVPAICSPEEEHPVEVATLLGVRSDRVVHPGRPAEALAMEPGEFRRLADPSEFCVHFAPAGDEERYLLGVQSTSEAPGSLTPVAVHGMGEDPAATPVAADGSAASSGSPAAGLQSPSGSQLVQDRVATTSGGSAERWERHYRGEARIRAEDRRLGERLVRERHGHVALESPGAAVSPEAQGTLPPGVAEGDTLTVRIPDLDGSSLCEDYKETRVVARRVGDEAVWLEDTEHASPAFDGEGYDALMEDFDRDVHPAVVDHFGEPTDLDGTGRVAVVISEVINDFDAGVLGFVTTADFFGPDEGCDSSDYGEYFYVRAPEGESAYGSIDEARMDLRRLAAHELTHLIQFGRRVERGTGRFQAVWELEGQAVLAEEVAGYRSLGREPRSNLGFEKALGRDQDPETGVRWHLRATNDLFRYFGLEGTREEWSRVEEAPEECTWLARDASGTYGAPCEMRRRDPYGVAWSFLRWTADHLHEEWSGGEADFHRGLIDATTTGFESVEALTGRPREDLLARWAASLYADGRVPEDGTEGLDFPSWDLLDIDRALREEDDLPEEARLLPRRRSYGDFTDEISVRGGSSAYFVLEGAERGQTFVRATGREDPLLPEHMQLWIVRLR